MIFGDLCNNCGKTESKNSKSNIIRAKLASGKNYYERCRSALSGLMYSGTMRRILGFNWSGTSISNSDIWFLGVRYLIGPEGDSTNSVDHTHSEGFAAFVEDFSSRIWITYRKGFVPIGNAKYNSDVGWGCMHRSSQMLVAQAFLFHILGRSWRKSEHMAVDQKYLEILHLFGDSEESPFSLHNLLQAGKTYGLAPGSWVGPFAMCRTWETLVHNKMEETDHGILSSKMVIYVVSGEDGERGGAPVLCIEDIVDRCSKFNRGKLDWAPVLLMIPLVLGLEKINPRYLPLLSATIRFPQSLGILGGKPGSSTYINGVQDERVFYLDPHEVQQVVDIKSDNVNVDTSAYHCNVLRHIPLESIDSSLAIGFYCKDKSDFGDFCQRASELNDQSEGAPLFTIVESRSSPNSASYRGLSGETAYGIRNFDLFAGEESGEEDEWQLL